MVNLVCGKCKQILSTSEFHKQTRSKTGHQDWCKVCRKEWKHEERKEYHKTRYHSNKDAWLNNNYKKKYKITLEEYDKLLKEQNNSCAICNQTCITDRRLAVDHNHTTGKVRGLLCTKCNSLLGQANDDTAILTQAINYLKKKYS